MSHISIFKYKIAIRCHCSQCVVNARSLFRLFLTGNFFVKKLLSIVKFRRVRRLRGRPECSVIGAEGVELAVRVGLVGLLFVWGVEEEFSELTSKPVPPPSSFREPFLLLRIDFVLKSPNFDMLLVFGGANFLKSAITVVERVSIAFFLYTLLLSTLLTPQKLNLLILYFNHKAHALKLCLIRLLYQFSLLFEEYFVFFNQVGFCFFFPLLKLFHLPVIPFLWSI